MDSNNNSIQNLLDNFYKEYNTKLKPILALLEAEIQKFPINILNEVRAIHDHVARTYGDDLDFNQKEVQISLARRHINRAILDCYKIVIAIKDENIRKIIRNYRYTNLGEVNSGKFYPKLNKVWTDAKKIVREAKNCENKGHDNNEDTIKLLEFATIKYQEVEDFIEVNNDNLTWSSQNQKKRFWIGSIVAFIISLIAGFISGFLLQMILKIDLFKYLHF